MTYTISPTFISETKIGEYRITGNGGEKAGNDYTYALAKTVPGLPCERVPQSRSASVWRPKAAMPAVQLGVGTMGIQVNNVRQFNQDFTKIWGLHSFKFGYEYLWENEDSHNISNPRLTLNFTGSGGQADPTTGLLGNGSTISNTGGIALANLMLGTSPATAMRSRERRCSR